MENNVLTTNETKPKELSKSALVKKCKDLENDIKIYADNLKEADEAIAKRDQYIDHLYNNSNALTNKFEVIKVQINSIENLSKLTRSMLDLLDERIEAIKTYINN